jgi:VanZ family protein
VNDRIQWSVVAVLAVGVLVASLLPAEGASALGPFGVLGLDKWLHAVGYATLAGAVSLADGRAIVGVLAAVAYGASIELLQLGVSYRSGSALDALANATGAVVGALAVVAVVDAYRRYDARGSSRSTVEK